MSGQSARFGFTLAEVLVTLGIIGVVSAMTVPSLMQNHQRKTYVTQLHKVYNEIQQALMQYQTDKNAVNLTEAGLTSIAAVKSFLQTYFRVIETCDGVTSPCFSTTYKNMNGDNVAQSVTWGAASCVVISSGASFCIDRPDYATISYGGYTTTYGNVFIDVNGAKGPNILGRDAYYLAIFPDGVLDVNQATPVCRKQGICNGGSIKDVRGSIDNCKTATSNSYDCFGKILNDNWEMTY